MLLEFFVLILSFATLLAILAITIRHPVAHHDGGEKDEKSKVVTLGPFETIVNLFRLFSSQSAPSYEISQKISKEYGKVVMVSQPFKRQVVLNVADMSVGKSILNSSSWANKFAGDYYVYDLLDGEPLGLMFGNDGYWKEGRKLTLKLLHQLGFFREEKMGKIAQLEVAELVQVLERKTKADGGVSTLRIQNTFQIYALNIVYQLMVGGKRFEAQDPVAHMLLSALRNFLDEYNPGTSLFDIFPWLRHLPFIGYYKTIKKFNQVFHNYFQKYLIESRRREGTYRENPVDFVDHFLLEIDRRAGEKPCYLNDTHLSACMRDLVAGSLDTTSASLEHGILHVCLRPGIQKKVQQEIDQVIGAVREPCYEDRKHMPYTQAVLLEILRYSTPVAFATRCPLRDGEIHGTVIPKGSNASVNLYAIHHSKDLWSDPDDFRPERFLNEKNELVNLDKIMPFGHGKRACIGEFVAKISLFIFFVSLLQNFTFELSKAHGPPCLKNTKGLSHAPLPYYVTLRRRGSASV